MKRHWIGPLLGWELVRLGRRGSVTLLRTAVGLLILVALYLTTAELREHAAQSLAISSRIGPSNFDYNNQMRKVFAGMAEAFNQKLMLAEIALVILMTPVLVVGALAEERDRKTLEFLLSTDLSSWEILLGKLGSRIVQATTALLVCIPIIAITQVWGGVDLMTVVTAFGISLVSIVSTAALSLSVGLRSTTLRGSLLRCYAAIAAVYYGSWGFYSATLPLWGRRGKDWVGYYFGTPTELQMAIVQYPAEFADLTPRSLGSIGTFLAFNVLVTAFCLWDSCSRFRALALREKPRKVVPRHAEKPEKRHWTDPPKIPQNSDGLYWKERHFAGTRNRLLINLSLVPSWLWTAITFTFGMIALTAFAGSNDAVFQSGPIRWGGIVFLSLAMLVVGMAACSSVARERQKETLVDLVMIPGSRREILAAKWWGSRAQARGVAVGFLSICLVGVVCGSISPFALPGMVLAGAVWVGVAVSLGLWLSVRCASVQRASVYWLLLALGLFGASHVAGRAVAAELSLGPIEPRNFRYSADPFYVYPLDAGTADYNRLIEVTRTALSPYSAWGRLCFATEERDAYNYFGRKRGLTDPETLIPPALDLLLLAALSRLLWLSAHRRFRSEILK